MNRRWMFGGLVLASWLCSGCVLVEEVAVGALSTLDTMVAKDGELSILRSHEYCSVTNDSRCDGFITE